MAFSISASTPSSTLAAICSPSRRTSALPSGVFMRSRMSAASVCLGFVELFLVIGLSPWCNLLSCCQRDYSWKLTLIGSLIGHHGGDNVHSPAQGLAERDV